VHVTGTVDDLAFDADLATPGGPLAVDGRMSGSGAARRIAATAEAHGFRLDAFRDGLPRTTVSGTLTVDVTGTSLGTMSGPVQVVLDSTRFGELPHSTLLLGARFGEGLLTVDSAFLRGPLGTGRAMGTVALIEGIDGRLEAGYTSESLTALEPFLYRNRGPATDGEPRVAGRVDALATVTGWLRDLAIDATATGDDILLGPVAAAKAHAEARLSGLGSADAGFRLTATADSAGVFRHSFQVARMDLAGTRDSVSITAGSTVAGEDRLFARAAVHRSTGTGDTTAVQARVDELRLGGRSPWVLADPAAVRIENGVALVDPVVLVHAAGGRVTAGGRLAWANSTVAAPQSVEFSVNLTRLPFADLLGALRSGTTGAGTIDGSLRIAGNTLDPFIETEITARDIEYGDVRIDRAYAEINYLALGVDAHAEAQYAGRSILTGGGRGPLDLRLASVGERRLSQALRLNVTADSLPPGLPLEQIWVWDIDPAKATACARDLHCVLGVRAEAAQSMSQATRACEVIVTCTTARKPFLGPQDVSPGSFIAAVGADNPEKSEIAPALMSKATVVTDVLAQCADMGDLHHAIAAGAMTAAQVHAELGDVVAGAKPGRRRRDEVIVFDSTGTAIQDVASAAFAYERAREIGRGLSFSFA
jgi:hypothetical protein